MLDLFHLPKSAKADLQIFRGNSPVSAVAWQAWNKPRGKTLAYLLCLGAGGNGGTGVIGLNSTAGGGGGGGSGGQAVLIIPTYYLPDILYISCGTQGSGATTTVAIAPLNLANQKLLTVNGGSNGANASGGGGGAGGGGAANVGIASSPLAGIGIINSLSGQDGGPGGSAGGGGGVNLPGTGIIVTGGTGGGGLPAAATTGTNGGDPNFPAPTAFYPSHLGGVGPSVATNPASIGATGYQGFSELFFAFGGTGGSSTHGTATGGGLVQAAGGNGGPGSGGGGMGGALTGSTAAVTSLGGEGFGIILCW